MNYSDLQLTKLGRDEVMKLDRDVRLHWFRLLQVRHRELDTVASDLAHLMHPDNETRLVALIGMTGVGKTMLARRVLQKMLMKVWEGNVAPSDVPFIFVAAPANGERSLSWKVLYQRILANANEILIDQKRQTLKADGFMKLGAGRGTVAALRESVESMLVNRNVRLVVIDEAVHLLRFERYSAVMDTLKSLADIHTTKILLLGSYDLVDLVTDYGQVARRSDILHYKRYRSENPKGSGPEDKKEFGKAVLKLQNLWPAKVVPKFSAITDVLMEAALGSVGLLKALMLGALEMQLSADGEVWDTRYLERAAKSTKLLKRIRDETMAGEAKLDGVSFGESVFSDPSLMAKVTAKMA